MLRTNVTPRGCDNCSLRAQQLKAIRDPRMVDWDLGEDIVKVGYLSPRELFSICCCLRCARLLLDEPISEANYWDAREKKREAYDSAIIELNLKKWREKVVENL